MYIWDGNDGSWLVGIPVGNAAHLVTQVVGMPMLDRHLDLTSEIDRVFQVEDVTRLVAAVTAPKLKLRYRNGIAFEDR